MYGQGQQGQGGRGMGMGRGRKGGRRGGGRGAGPTGNCVCPVCGYTVPHEPGVPCSQLTCPKCGVRLIRA